MRDEGGRMKFTHLIKDWQELNSHRENQDRKSQGQEGRLAPAWVECHRVSGGKPPFLTLSFSSRSSAFWSPSFSISLLSLLGALVILASLSSSACSANQGSKSLPPEVESTISTLGDEINAERYDKIYNEASEQWRLSSTLEEATTNFKTLRAKLGPVESRTLQSATEQQNSGGALKGRAYIVSYRTKFQNGEGMETFTLVEKDGRWQLARYFVNSTALK